MNSLKALMLECSIINYNKINSFFVNKHQHLYVISQTFFLIYRVPIKNRSQGRQHFFLYQFGQR